MKLHEINKNLTKFQEQRLVLIAEIQFYLKDKQYDKAIVKISNLKEIDINIEYIKNTDLSWSNKVETANP